VHVVFLPHRFLPARGGVQTVFARTARALEQSGHRATVVTSVATTTGSLGWPTEGLLPAGPAVVDGVTILRLPIQHMGKLARTAAHAMKGRLGDAGGPVREALRRRLIGPYLPSLRAELQRLAPDLVVGAGLPYRHVFDARRWTRELGIPYAVMPCVHVHRPDDHASGSAKRLYREADHLLPLTKFEADLLIEWGADPKRVQVLPLGPDLPPEHESLSATDCGEALGVPGTRPYLLYVGRLSPQKHLPLLLDAFAAGAADLHATDLVLAGGATSWSRDALPTEIARRQLTDRVKVIADFPAAAKRALLAGAQALVNPSHEESFGIVFLEAWACGRPVIGADIGPIRSLIEEGRGPGQLFAPGSVAELSSRLVACAADRQESDAATPGADSWAAAAATLLSLV